MKLFVKTAVDFSTAFVLWAAARAADVNIISTLIE